MSFRSGEVRRGVALLTLLLVLCTPAVFGDDGVPNQPPEARIKPPIGSQSVSDPNQPPEARISPPIGAQSSSGPNQPPEARISPPGGVQSTSNPGGSPGARILPPIGSQSVSFFGLLGDWIGFYARLIPLVF